MSLGIPYLQVVGGGIGRRGGGGGMAGYHAIYHMGVG